MKHDLYDDWIPTYSGGAFDGGSGVSLPSVSPLFDEWASAVNNPPSGIGSYYKCGWVFVFCSGSYLYAVSNDPYGSGRGIYRYSVNTGADPITMTPVDFVSLASLGIGSLWNERLMDFDATDNTVLLSSYTSSSATTASVGRWSLSNWPFTSANATWKGVPCSYGSLISGQIPYLAENFAIDKTNNRLVISGYAGAQACVFNYATGAFLGEQQWSSTWSTNNHPMMIGLNSDGHVLVGGYISALHSGRVHEYDISNPASWSDQGQVIDRDGTAYNVSRGNAYGRPIPSWGLGNYGRVRSVGLGQVLQMGWGSESYVLQLAKASFYGASYAQNDTIFRHNTTADEFEEYNIGRTSTYNRAGLGISLVTLASFSKINDALWFFTGSVLSKDQLAEQPNGAPYAAGVTGMHADIGVVEWEKAITASEIPKVITHPVAINSRNVNHSDHPSKFAFRLSVDNGASWTGWRTGTGLSNLQSTVDGDPAWPTLIGTVKLQQRLSSGIIKRFGTVHAQSDVDTEPIPISDFGPPSNVRPFLFTDPKPRLIGL